MACLAGLHRPPLPPRQAQHQQQQQQQQQQLPQHSGAPHSSQASCWTPGRRPRSRRVACSSGGGSTSGSGSDSADGLPASTSAVAEWAELNFKETVNTSMIKACLLLALEEEAAAQTAYAEAEMLPAPENEGGAGAALAGSGVGSAATWSLDRVASLAEEATHAFYAKLHDLGVADAVLLAAKQVPDSTLLTLHQDMVHNYPTQLITAVNHVLFERHGYRRQRRWGDPRDSRLSNVLESGNGSPASLAVLYQEVCSRLSMPLQQVSLEGGRYFVLMPTEGGPSLSVAGERFVIDPYSEGMLLSQEEVKELFEVEGELRPCSNATLLAGMLAVLQESHWCAAVGCPPEPIFAVPISLEVALGEYRDVEVSTSSGEDDQGQYFTVSFTQPGADGEAGPSSGGGSGPGQQWWPAQGYNLQRALAAARKRTWLLPDDLNVLLEYALLLFFSKRYDDAWQELGCVLQAAKSEAAARLPVQTFDPEEIEQMEILWEKIRLLLAFA